MMSVSQNVRVVANGLLGLVHSLYLEIPPGVDVFGQSVELRLTFTYHVERAVDVYLVHFCRLSLLDLLG